ncbi:SSI family serine proteinase inhibitor [Streptomyces sp. NPDC005573]|uniref:SSI family serine proteinase inhibitor n=1 Tax=Streptomyces sp. NPDC005573 TaxID=3156890 RepID=UPI0033AB65A1
MTYLTRAAAAAGALLAAAGLLAASPAQAATRGSAPGDWLYLTVTRGDAQTGTTTSALLMCDPPTGHPHAAQACAELAAADGDIDRIPHQDVFCPLIYAPVSVHARGSWNGRPVDYEQTYTSKCVMDARTGAVFALEA